MRLLLLVLGATAPLASALAIASAPRSLAQRPHYNSMPQLGSVAAPRRSGVATMADATDYKQIATYPTATALQCALIASVFKGIDTVVGTLPGFAIPPIFLFLSLRSRVFSLLPASRPKRSDQDGNATPREVKRPSWTPPGIAFPFIWSTISLLRAFSSLLVWHLRRMLST